MLSQVVENTFIFIIANVLPFGCFKKLLQVDIVLGLCHATDSQIVSVSECSSKFFLLNELIHNTLETSRTVRDAKWDSSGLAKASARFEGCVWLVFILYGHLMVGATQIDGAKYVRY